MQNRTFSQWMGHSFATLIGWQVSVAEPVPPKCVIVGAYHTSAWDFALTLILKWATGLPLHFVIKASLCRGPMGWVMGWLGAIPVDRSIRQDFVAQVAAEFEQHDTFLVAISPEGTRAQEHFWRTGFYYIALAVKVPVVLGYADYRRKVVGLGPILWPSGDINADFDEIRRFYTGVIPKNPAKQGPIRTRPANSRTGTGKVL